MTNKNKTDQKDRSKILQDTLPNQIRDAQKDTMA
jgi:hypothetical protein